MFLLWYFSVSFLFFWLVFFLKGLILKLSFDVCRSQRAKPVIIDPGLYMSKKADVFWITQRRSVPTAFKLFTGKF